MYGVRASPSRGAAVAECVPVVPPWPPAFGFCSASHWLAGKPCGAPFLRGADWPVSAWPISPAPPSTASAHFRSSLDGSPAAPVYRESDPTTGAPGVPKRSAAPCQ